METDRFSRYPKGTIFRLLWDAYSGNSEFRLQYEQDWRNFDYFIYDNLKFMDKNGFMSLEDEVPIGFMSWDPRRLPSSVEIGHNCIITQYQGTGRGKEQLAIGLEMIVKLQPKTILVKTGNIPFFIPARKMYEGAGFIQRRAIRKADELVPEIIEYVKLLSNTL